ncbi:hypothetical protein V6N13_043237 [Hibiscus sabdariffa]
MLRVFSESSVPTNSLPPSVGTDVIRPNADPLDPGRIVDSLGDATSVMDVSGPAVSPALPSYKDTLMASEPFLRRAAADITNEEEVVLLEGDVTRSDVNGLISIQFSERVQVMEYEALPAICFDYGLYGYVKDIFPSSVHNLDASRWSSHVEPIAPSMTESFGPWIMVERRQCRHQRKDSGRVPSTGPLVVQESRFNPIFEDDTSDVSNLPVTLPAVLLPASVTFDSAVTSVEVNPTSPIVPMTISNDPMTVVNDLMPHALSPRSKELVSNRPKLSKQHTPPKQRSPPKQRTSPAQPRFAPFPRPPSKFNKSKHTAAVLLENDDPNVQGANPSSLPLPPSEPPGVSVSMGGISSVAISMSPKRGL